MRIALTLDETSNELSAWLLFAPEAAEPYDELPESLIQEGGHGGLHPIKQGRKSPLKTMRDIHRKLPGLMAAQASDTPTPGLRQYFQNEELRFVIVERRDARGTPRTLRSAREQQQEISERRHEVNRIGAILPAKASGATAEIKDELRRVSAMKKNPEKALQKLRSHLQALAAKLSTSEAGITACDTIHASVAPRVDGTTRKIRIERLNCSDRLCEWEFMHRRAESTGYGKEAEAEIDDIAEAERASVPWGHPANRINQPSAASLRLSSRC